MASIMAAVDYSNPDSMGSRFRRRRIRLVEEMIDRIFAEKGSVQILDVGGVRQYWRLFADGYLGERKVSVTLLNFDATQLDLESDGLFTTMQGDGCDLSRFADGAFDLVHSNSTIEHVGDFNKMVAFAKETQRVGRAYYVQTPYYWFPIEPHFVAPFFHWLPDGLRAKILVANLLPHKGGSPDIIDAMRRIQGARLLDWSQMRALFPDASLSFEKLGFVPKSIVARRGAGF